MASGKAIRQSGNQATSSCPIARLGTRYVSDLRGCNQAIRYILGCPIARLFAFGHRNHDLYVWRAPDCEISRLPDWRSCPIG